MNEGPLVIKAPLMGNLDSLVERLRPRASNNFLQF